MWRYILNLKGRTRPKAITRLSVFAWIGVACCVAVLAWAWHSAPRAASTSRLATGNLVELTAFDRGGYVGEPTGLGVSIQQVVAAVNMPTGFESESLPSPCFVHFKTHGAVRCYKDRTEDCYLVLTGNPSDVELISVWVRVEQEQSSLGERVSRKVSLFDQVIHRAVAAIDPDSAGDVRRWAITNIPLAMRTEAGAFAKWGRWMTKIKCDANGDQRYSTFLIGLPVDDVKSGDSHALVAASGVVYMP